MAKWSVGDLGVYQKEGMMSRLLQVTEVGTTVVVAGGYRFCKVSGNRIFGFPAPADRIGRFRKADAKDIATARINKAQEALHSYKVGETNLEQVEQFLRGSL